jgi:hypothetical protein
MNEPMAIKGFCEKVYNGRRIPRYAVWLLLAIVVAALIAMSLSSG